MAPGFIEKKKLRFKEPYRPSASPFYTVDIECNRRHGRETNIDTMQMERCYLFHHGKSHHSWCRTGNDTQLRKLSTMTWSFFNIDGLCFCGNKIVCVFVSRYKWQIFPSSVKTSPYLHSESSMAIIYLSFLLTDRITAQRRFGKDQRDLGIYFHQRVEALYWWFSGSGFVL